MKRATAWLVLASLSLAASPPFLSALERHPQLKAARAHWEAARLEAGYAADARGGWSLRALADPDPCPFLSDPDPSNDVLCSFLNPEVPKSAGRAEVGVVFRPVLFGDLADQQEAARLAAAGARIDYRAAKSRLEAAALGAALRFWETEQSLALTREALELAQKNLRITELRERNGAAQASELRRAKRTLEEARIRVLDAQESLRVARLALESFTTAAPPTPPWFQEPLPRGEPPEVRHARLKRDQARTGLRHTRRDLLPVVELGYQHPLDENYALGLSLESRTLSLRGYYAYQGFFPTPRDGVPGTNGGWAPAGTSP